MAIETVRFNKSVLSALVNEGIPIKVKDTMVNCLKFKVGKKRSVFYFEKRISGQIAKSAVTITLGAFPSISIEEARQVARELASQCEKGIDPRKAGENLFEEKKALPSQQEEVPRPAVTLQMCVDKFLEVKTGLRKLTLRKYKDEIRKRFPKNWLALNMNDITPEMLVSQFHIARKTARERCFEFLKVFSNVWNTCAPLMLDERKKRILGLNPVPDARRAIQHIHRDPPSRPYIPPEYIGPFVRLVETMSRVSQTPNLKICKNQRGKKKIQETDQEQSKIPAIGTQRYCQMILLALFTGMRGVEVRNLKWTYVDLESGFLTLPGEVRNDPNGFEGTKNHHEHTVPLSAYAWQLLRDIHKRRTTISDYVFPSVKDTKKTMSISYNINKKISKTLGVNFCFHSCRRTFACVGEEVGLDLFKIKRALNHSYRGGVTGIYINPQFNPETRRKYFGLIGDYILLKKGDHTPETLAS